MTPQKLVKHKLKKTYCDKLDETALAIFTGFLQKLLQLLRVQFLILHLHQRILNTIASDVPGRIRIPKINIKAQQSAFNKAIETQV